MAQNILIGCCQRLGGTFGHGIGPLIQLIHPFTRRPRYKGLLSGVFDFNGYFRYVKTKNIMTSFEYVKKSEKNYLQQLKKVIRAKQKIQREKTR